MFSIATKDFQDFSLFFLFLISNEYALDVTRINRKLSLLRINKYFSTIVNPLYAYRQPEIERNYFHPQYNTELFDFYNRVTVSTEHIFISFSVIILTLFFFFEKMITLKYRRLDAISEERRTSTLTREFPCI